MDSPQPDPPIRLAVTHSSAGTRPLYAEARAFAAASGYPYLPRNRRPLKTLLDNHGLDGCFVVEQQETALHLDGQRYAYHPNAAKLRFISLAQGHSDRLAGVMDLKPGDSVLDCTCGLGADALIAAHTVGPQGRVLALEKSPHLAHLVIRGMQTYRDEIAALNEAIARVKVRQADSDAYLAGQAPGSWDVVYFDPLFSATVHEARGLDIVRQLGRDDVLSPQTVQRARRAARRWVVLKDRTPGTTLARLGFEKVSSARRICYGRLPPLP